MKAKGILYTVLSAIIFGIVPILVKLAYAQGGTSATVTFLRAALCLPLTALVLRRQGVSLRLEQCQLRPLLYTGIIGTSGTTLLLSASYSFISAGLSTTLHFIYPMLIVAACTLFYQEPLTLPKGGALVLALGGVALFFEPGGQTAAFTGMALALASGCTYAFYVISLDKTNLKEMHYLKLSLYINAIMALCSLAAGLARGQLRFDLTLPGWLYCLAVSLLASLGATPLFQLGVRYTGASTAAILSTFEPITSIVAGYLVLGEPLSPAKIAGCVLILSSVALISLAPQRARPRRREAKVP